MLELKTLKNPNNFQKDKSCVLEYQDVYKDEIKNNFTNLYLDLCN